MIDYSAFSWRRTNASPANRRFDDIWFVDGKTGWGVNANGLILKTQDGGRDWALQKSLPGVYLRCIAFANPMIGWVGTTAGMSPDDRLLRTLNGGMTWERISNLPAGGPKQICGIWVVDENTVYACGSNVPEQPTALIKTSDGGESWTVVDMKPHAASLIDIYFRDANNGWVTGGQDSVKCGGRAVSKPDLIPVVLRTRDGGRTWSNLIERPEVVRLFPRGEWGWKIQPLEPATLVVTLQNYRDGAILRSDDDGQTWRRLRVNDQQRNSNLEGIGFLDEQRGWVGGWGDLDYQGGFSSSTMDGGQNWGAANGVLFRINRFRMIGSPVWVAYAAGESIYKFTDEPLVPVMQDVAEAVSPIVAGDEPVEIPVMVEEGARDLLVDVFEPSSGMRVRTLCDERIQTHGHRSLSWDLTDENGQRVPAGVYFVRISNDDRSESLSVRCLG